MIHHLLRLAKDRVQMGLALETLGVDLINVLGTGGSRCKPTALGHNFQAADWGIVARGFGQLGGDWLAREVDVYKRQILVPLPRPGPRRLTGERGALAAHYSRNIPSAEIAK